VSQDGRICHNQIICNLALEDHPAHQVNQVQVVLECLQERTHGDSLLLVPGEKRQMQVLVVLLLLAITLQVEVEWLAGKTQI
jgi:hypothetical protein